MCFWPCDRLNNTSRFRDGPLLSAEGLSRSSMKGPSTPTLPWLACRKTAPNQVSNASGPRTFQSLGPKHEGLDKCSTWNTQGTCRPPIHVFTPRVLTSAEKAWSHQAPGPFRNGLFTPSRLVCFCFCNEWPVPVRSTVPLRRGIPPGGVAPRANTASILTRRA